MNTSRTALVAAAACVALWISKAVAIGLAGGVDNTLAPNLLFLLGLVAHVTACVALALWVTRSRSTRIRVLAGTLVVPAAIAAAALLTVAVAAFEPADAGWVWAEINLWISAGVVLALSVAAHHRTTAATGARLNGVVASDFR